MGHQEKVGHSDDNFTIEGLIFIQKLSKRKTIFLCRGGAVTYKRNLPRKQALGCLIANAEKSLYNDPTRAQGELLTFVTFSILSSSCFV